MIPSARTVRDAFPRWTQSQCRAYRAGIAAVDRGDVIEVDSLYPDERFYGAADAIGEEAYGADWLPDGWTIRHEWWLEDSEGDDLE